MTDVKNEITEVLTDAKKVQDALAKNNITTKEYLHSIPVLLNEFYPENKELMNISKMIIQETAILHKILNKK